MYNYTYAVYMYIFNIYILYSIHYILYVYICICGLLYNISVFTSMTVLEVRADRGHIAWWDMKMDI